MAITLKSTLLDLGLTEDDVEAHVLEIIQARPTGAERRSALSYIRQLVQRDEDDLEVYRALIARARSVLEDREILHTFDIRGTKHANLFTVATGVDYETPLTVANSEIMQRAPPSCPPVVRAESSSAQITSVSTASAPVAPSTRRFSAAAS